VNFPLDVQMEINRARVKHPAIHSLHEGYAVLLEEVDELWERVRMPMPALLRSCGVHSVWQRRSRSHSRAQQGCHSQA
jgi:hypothetical protein